MGGYNHTFFAAVRQRQFYLVRHPLAAAIHQLQQPENTTLLSMRELLQIPEASSIAAGFFPAAAIDKAVAICSNF